MPTNKPIPYREFRKLSKEQKAEVRRAHFGQCEVEGCTERAVAYYASAMWRLCATHGAKLAKRSKERYV
jgi:hypothetical protein